MISGLWRLGCMIAGAATLAGGPALAEERQRPECFSTAQTREQIARRKLAEPFASMQTASRETQGDPISAKLCRMDEMFLYEINLLRRDGRLIKIFIDAVSGKPHPGARDR